MPKAFLVWMLHVILPLRIHFSRPLQKLSSKKQNKNKKTPNIRQQRINRPPQFTEIRVLWFSLQCFRHRTRFKTRPSDTFKLLLAVWADATGEKRREFYFLNAFHNVINHSFIVANMNCAPNVTNLVLFAKIKGWIIAQNADDYNYEALIISGR